MKLNAFLLACLLGMAVTFAQAPTPIVDEPILTEPKPASVTVEQKLRAQVLHLQQQLAAVQKQVLTLQASWWSCQDKLDTAAREAQWQQLSKDAGCVVNRTTFQCEPSKP